MHTRGFSRLDHILLILMLVIFDLSLGINGSVRTSCFVATVQLRAFPSANCLFELSRTFSPLLAIAFDCSSRIAIPNGKTVLRLHTYREANSPRSWPRNPHAIASRCGSASFGYVQPCY
jgi:hypothetical protein